MGSDMIPAQLDVPLGKLRTRVFVLACLRGAGIAISIFLIGCVVTGWADLIVALPSTVRVVLFAACIFGALGALTAVIFSMKKQATSRKLAAALDRVGETGGQIQAGVELSETIGHENPLTADLKRRAIALSSVLASQQNLAAARPAAPALKPYICAGAVLLFLGLAWLAWPGLVAAQAARVLDPRIEHAPHCPYTFTIRPSADAIIYGDPFEVSVHVTGANPGERFEWVIDQPGRAAWRLPLLSRSDGDMQGNIASVLSDFSFSVEGPRGRSEATRIAMITVPEIRETAVKLAFPEYTHLPPVEGPLTEGGPSGVRGTRVTLLIASNRPLSGGTIEIQTSIPDGEAARRRNDAAVRTEHRRRNVRDHRRFALLRLGPRHPRHARQSAAARPLPRAARSSAASRDPRTSARKVSRHPTSSCLRHHRNRDRRFWHQRNFAVSRFERLARNSC